MSLSGRSLIENVNLPERESSRPGLRKRSLSGTEAGQPDSKKARMEAAGEQALKAEPVCTGTKETARTNASTQPASELRFAPSPVHASDTPWQGRVDSKLLHLLSDLLSHGFFLHETNDIGVVLMTRIPGQVIHGGFHLQIRWKTLSMVDSPASLSGMALQHLISQGNLKAVDYLVRHGAALPAHHAADAALVRQAALEGRAQLLEALLRLGADILTPDANGRCLLHHAVDAGIADAVALLCVPGAADQPDRNGDTPLLLAIREDKGLDICAALLRRGADPDCRDREGRTALTTAIAKYDNMAVAALLRAGANPNLADGLLDTPLHLACANGNEEAVLILLGKGCATDRTDALGRTALDIAMQTGMEADVLELLRYCTPVAS